MSQISKGRPESPMDEQTNPDHDDAERMERAVLGCILESPVLIVEVEADLSDCFLLADHRALLRAMLKLHGEGIQPDTALLPAESGLDAAFIGGLLGAGYLPTNFRTYTIRVRKAFQNRQFHRLHEELGAASADDRPRILQQLTELNSSGESGAFRRLKDIPDLQTMVIEPPDWIVPGLFARHALIQYAGAGGSAKTWVMLSLAIAVARGERHLGQLCKQVPVLYVDYENPAWAVRERVDAMTGGESIPGLHIWGTWNKLQPPRIGDPVLLEICRRDRPLLIIDPLRMGHTAKENESDEMSPIMRHLRRYAVAGACVIFVHHVAKSEGSTGRGSSAIFDAVDGSYLQEIQKDGNILLRCEKNRFGPKDRWTLLPNWDTGTFVVSASSEAKKSSAAKETILQIISEKPGVTQNEAFLKSGMGRNRFMELLKEHKGELWEERESREHGRRSLRYYPVPANTVHGGYNGTQDEGFLSTGVPRIKSGTRYTPQNYVSPVLTRAVQAEQKTDSTVAQNGGICQIAKKS